MQFRKCYDFRLDSIVDEMTAEMRVPTLQQLGGWQRLNQWNMKQDTHSVALSQMLH